MNAKPDWQQSYVLSIRDAATALRQERWARTGRRIYDGPRSFVVDRLSDSQIDSLARQEAERAVQQAINRGIAQRSPGEKR